MILNLFYKNLKWTIWEFIEYDASKRDWANKNYEKLVRKVAWFDNMITFHQAWNRVPHADIRKLLFDGESFKVFKDHEGHNYQVTCLMLFKHGIIPAYEDKRNKEISDLRSKKMEIVKLNSVKKIFYYLYTKIIRLMI